MAGLERTITMKTGEYRPCMVNGHKALFHRWSDKETLFFKCDHMVKKEAFASIRLDYEKYQLLPNGVTVEKIKNTVAIVEFEDGFIKEVLSTDIRFLDSGNLFYGNSIFFKEENKS